MIPVRPWQAAKPCNCTTTDRDAEIARMEAAPAAPESLQMRVAQVIYDGVIAQWTGSIRDLLAANLDPRPSRLRSRRGGAVSGRRGDAEMASVMRKLLAMPGPDGYAAIDVMNGTFDIDCTGLQLTEDEQQAIEEEWDR